MINLFRFSLKLELHKFIILYSCFIRMKYKEFYDSIMFNLKSINQSFLVIYMNKKIYLFLNSLLAELKTHIFGHASS